MVDKVLYLDLPEISVKKDAEKKALNDNMKKAKLIPYYFPNNKIGEQVIRSSKRRELNPMLFLYIKMRNNLFQMLAYNCPINSWRVWLHRRRGVHIGNHVMLGMHCILDNAYPEYIYIEDYAALAGHVYVLAHSNPYKHFSKILESYVAPVIIREGAWIGVSTTILSGAEVGKYSIVTAGSVVTGKMPENCFLRGNPARVIARYKL